MLNRWADWAHVMASFRGQWLPGDVRGFRSRQHFIHSSGHYKSPPPPDEHAGLRVYSRSISKQKVKLSSGQCDVVACAIHDKLNAMGVACAALAVAPTHVHVLIQVDDSDAVKVFGRAKQFASHQLSHEIPGRIWGRGAHVIRIRSEAHYSKTIAYIIAHEGQGASVWLREPASSCDCVALRGGVGQFAQTSADNAHDGTKAPRHRT